MNIDHPYIFDIMYNYYSVSSQGKEDNICWNEADKLQNPRSEFDF